MSEYTPMMKHYLQIKAQNPDALVFYRLGDFYEMFFEDAKIASHELDLVLTGRNAGVEEKVPMCGVPFHAVNGYIQRLIAKGYKVAIVEQLEDPSDAVGLVKRDVIKIVTPGTIMDELTDEIGSIYLAGLVDYGYGYSLAICDCTTGEGKLLNISHDQTALMQTIVSNEIKEIVTDSNFNKKVLVTLTDNCFLTISQCEQTDLKNEYKHLLNGCDDIHMHEALGRLLNYLEITQKRTMSQLRPFEVINEDDYLKMDYSTLMGLELIQPGKNNNKSITLYSFLNNCRSAIGARLLKKWVNRPLRDLKKINQRLDMITYLNKNFLKREELKEYLSELYDLERIVARIAYGSANPKDCQRLAKSLEKVPQILEIVRQSGCYPQLDNIDTCRDIYGLLTTSLVDDPPVFVRDGGIFKDGYDRQLDEYRDILKNGKKWIASLEQSERERTQIKTLKIGYNRVFGYYIEVSKGALGQIKEEWGYQRKQTLANGERFITVQLKEKEDMILHAEEKSLKLETVLFNELLEKIKHRLAQLQQLSNALALIDALYSLSVISSGFGYVRPNFNEQGILDIVEGKHPILNSFKNIQYVANDLYMDKKISTIVITGPNMGGKSTYMRQCVLLCIMAQIGCYLPAKKAYLPLFDQIFTRIGSTDDILSGQSTFMVEMLEANNALSKATENSLIIFDEIGRGTSTYDGMALAQAMLEYIDATIRAKTLFSTHYHELTALENNMEHLRNKHVMVAENNGDITFLYKVKDGKADKSYGIHVASLAKLPQAVIDRAKELLKDLESNKKVHNDQGQIIMLEKVPNDLQEVKSLLELADPNNMTPLEALQFVNTLKGKIKDSKK